MNEGDHGGCGQEASARKYGGDKKYLQELGEGIQHLRGPNLQAFIPACCSLFVGDIAQVQDS